MKVYIVYLNGDELPRDKWIKAGSHNAAEKKAQAKYPGQQVSVAYQPIHRKQSRGIMADRYTYSGNDRIPVITLREALKRRGFPIEHLKVDDYVLRRADEILVACKDNWTAYLNEGGKPWAYVGMSTELFALAECKPEDRADTNYCWITSTSYAVVVDKTESWPGMIFSLVLPC